MSFLKTILIVLLVYFGLKFLFRFLKPYLIRYITKKAGQKFEAFFGDMPNSQPMREEKEGEISIDKVPQPKSQSLNGVGEYVDYEEVD